jgi:DNA invertase Pin-like site-specific DNA recombinase
MVRTNKKHQRVTIYTRVSKASQTTDNQLRELQGIIERQGWTVVEVYTDHGISGAKGRDKRPSFDQLYKDASRRRFDMVMAWSIDRIGRSVHAVSGFIADMEALIGQYYHQQAIDTTTPSGKAMIQMCVVFAEFERGMIKERIHAGLKRAKDEGKTLGRPSRWRSWWAWVSCLSQHPVVRSRISIPAWGETGGGGRGY